MSSRTFPLFGFLLLGCFASIVHGQVPPPSSQCDSVLAANDVSLRVSQDQWDNYLFRNHCRKTDDSWSFDHKGDVGYESVKIFGTWTYDKTQVRNFCKRMESSAVGTHSEADYVSHVVRRSVAAWERCIELDAAGITIIPTMTQHHVHFEISRSRDDAILQSVVFSGFSGCVVSVDASNSVHKESPINLGAPIQTGSAVNIDCDRIQRVMEDQVSLPAGQISVNTSRGSLVLEFLDESVYSVGSSVARSLDTLTQQLAQLNASLSQPEFFHLTSGKSQRGSRSKGIGSHRFCALSRAIDAHGDYGCGCTVSPPKDGEDSEWTLTTNKEKVTNEACHCTAVCLN